jgi:hypothetical protein
MANRWLIVLAWRGQCLDDLWRAAVLRYALQIHNDAVTVENRAAELKWCVKQLEKTVPFEGSG